MKKQKNFSILLKEWKYSYPGCVHVYLSCLRGVNLLTGEVKPTRKLLIMFSWEIDNINARAVADLSEALATVSELSHLLREEEAEKLREKMKEFFKAS